MCTSTPSRIKFPSYALAAALAWVTWIPTSLLATGVDGAQDPSFGANGVTLADLSSFRPEGLGASSVAISPVSPHIYVGSGHFSVGRFLLTRYTSNGSRDLGFGSQGVASDKPAADAAWTYQLSGITVLPDGRPLAWGSATLGPDTDAVVCRYAVAGNLDATFGTQGCRRIGLNLIPNGREEARELIVLPNGSLQIVGTAQTPQFDVVNESAALLARLDSNGNLDTGFFVSGWRTWAQGAAVTAGDTVVRNPDGTLLVGGSFRVGVNGRHRYVAKFSDTGALLAAFGAGGSATVDFDSFGGNATTMADDAVSLLVDGQGRIYDCGRSLRITGEKNYHVTIARFTASGQLDPAFGTGGRMQRVFADVLPDNTVHSCLWQNDRLVVAMTRAGNPNVRPAMAMMRFLDSGAYDQAFGLGGLMDYPLDIGSNGLGRESGGLLAIQGRNLILAGGARASEQSPLQVAMIRVLKPEEMFSNGFEQP